MPATPDASDATPETVLGFDFGERKIGLAVGQSVTGTATPLTTLPASHGQPDWHHVESLISEWRPQALVIGLPLHMDGSESEITEAARRFGRRLHGRFGLPVHEIDERLSSEAARERIAAQRNAGRKRSDRGDRDAMAACLILEDYLRQADSMNRRGDMT
ncbi:MAG: Holliday junction resolvase RuvX [Gammaproteobacteria bacterium]|nr:Holliday junction resolvase RuvX [Gammaproteobacteria bacterium]MCP5136211.1 Holliday junction resolvase RuvX [Gammaproteobacteria bacterium]